MTRAVDPPDPDRCAEIAALLQDITGEDDAWLAGVLPASRLDADLLIDSLELAALSEHLRHRHGDTVDLIGHVTTLDIDGIIALSVADVAGLIDAAGLMDAGGGAR